jgi:hypothetical protein
MVGQEVVKYPSVNLSSIDIPTIMRGETGIITRDIIERDEHLKINAMQSTTLRKIRLFLVIYIINNT